MQHLLKECCKSTFCSVLLLYKVLWKCQPPAVPLNFDGAYPREGCTPKQDLYLKMSAKDSIRLRFGAGEQPVRGWFTTPCWVRV